jgi:hypothetical protein
MMEGMEKLMESHDEVLVVTEMKISFSQMMINVMPL